MRTMCIFAQRRWGGVTSRPAIHKTESTQRIAMPSYSERDTAILNMYRTFRDTRLDVWFLRYASGQTDMETVA